MDLTIIIGKNGFAKGFEGYSDDYENGVELFIFRLTQVKENSYIINSIIFSSYLNSLIKWLKKERDLSFEPLLQIQPQVGDTWSQDDFMNFVYTLEDLLRGEQEDSGWLYLSADGVKEYITDNLPASIGITGVDANSVTYDCDSCFVGVRVLISPDNILPYEVIKEEAFQINGPQTLTSKVIYTTIPVGQFCKIETFDKLSKPISSQIVNT